MTTNSINPKQKLYQELELISNLDVPLTAFHPGTETKQSFKTWLGQVWRSLVEALIEEPEVRVWQSFDRDGFMWWNAYDPETGETFYFDSEQEVRIWLEQSYSR